MRRMLQFVPRDDCLLKTFGRIIFLWHGSSMNAVEGPGPTVTKAHHLGEVTGNHDLQTASCTGLRNISVGQMWQ